MNNIEINPQFEKVLGFVNRTNQLIFLTGKAGTGKTTLLRYIREKTFKQVAVVAPTGVAAINAGGSTIHSFFQFPFSPFLPALKDNGGIDFSKNNLPTLKYNSQRLSIFRNLELLVIDEISMVRADLLDQIDVTLRFTRKKSQLPFGGVQVLLIGDMYQLPPVVQNEEWRLLSQVYKSQYFFDSLVIRNNPPVYIELDKIYRQSEQKFVTLLNKVRNNILDAESLELLNSHYKHNISEEDYRNNITLTTHNKKADEINSRNLNSLPGKEYKFKAKTEGQFPEKIFPADEALVLKKGTKVMFLKNNAEKNYYNGKIGEVTFIDDEKIKVKCVEDDYETDISKETWTNVSYKLDKNTKHIDEEVLGTFIQYPLRLAWAITIHKSQGLTFDKVIIDAAESFSAGQVYVALSRCRSLAGLTLSSRINKQSLLNDHSILSFSEGRHNNDQVDAIFNEAQNAYLRTVLLNLFDLSEFMQNRSDLAGIIQLYKARLNAEGLKWAEEFMQGLENLNVVSLKFQNQLAGILQNSFYPEGDEHLQTRIKQAAVYLEEEYKKRGDAIKNCQLVTESREASNELNEILQNMFEGFYARQMQVAACKEGFKFADFIANKLKIKYPAVRINVYATAKNSKVSAEINHPALYRRLLLLRDEICNNDHKPIYMVANNKALTELTNFLPVTNDHLLMITGFGEAKVESYGHAFLEVIRDYMAENSLETAMGTKENKKKKSKKTKAPKTDEFDQELPTSPVKLSTKEQTYTFYRQGLSLEEIARVRGLTLSTIEGHLVPYVAKGELKIGELVSEKKQKLIQEALEDFKFEEGINPIKSKLPADVSFSEIRLVMADKFKAD